MTADGMLRRPLAMTMAPNGHLLVTNGLNGQVVEIDPTTEKQIGGSGSDPDKAQTPPGSGDLFGIAMTPQGGGFYYVEDENNTLVLGPMSCPYATAQAPPVGGLLAATGGALGRPHCSPCGGGDAV